MDEIIAKWGNMRRDANEIHKIKRKIAQQKEQVNSVKVIVNHMDCLGNYGSIKKVLENNITSLENIGNLIDSLENTLNDAADAYHKTEQELSNADFVSLSDKIIDMIKEGFSSGNIPASILPYAKMFESGDMDAGDIAEALLVAPTSLFAFLTEVAEIQTEDGCTWKKAFNMGMGFDEYVIENTQAGEKLWTYFKQALKNDIDEFADMSSVAKGMGTVAKWAGVITEGIGEVIDNYEEYASGEISGGRAVAETVIETGVGVGMGMVATAAVGAVAVAAPVAVPAVVVAAASVAVVGGINFVSELLWDKDVGELFSDMICDAGESIAKWAMG